MKERTPRRPRHADHPATGRPGRPAGSFLKWAGAKSRVAEAILTAMPAHIGTYFEPMVGSGTVFLALAPERAHLADANPELIDTWRVVRDDVEALITTLDGYVDDRERFHQIRALDPWEMAPVDRAARMIYLNHTCFNGLYRLNKGGGFNVPYGRHRRPWVRDAELLRWVSARLHGVTLSCGDFGDAAIDADAGDVVYFDPPYWYASDKREGYFNRYGPRAFGDADHRRLADLARELSARGCHVLISNSDEPSVRELYEGFTQVTLTVRRPINRKATARDGWTELLIHTPL